MSRHWVLTTWNAKAMAGFPASIAAPLARCALSSRSMAAHLAVRDKGVPWIGIDSSDPHPITLPSRGCHLAGQKSPGALVACGASRRYTSEFEDIGGMPAFGAPFA